MRLIVLILCLIAPLFAIGEDDFTWWNELHGWEPGMPGWRYFMKITPGYLGPNALPVPENPRGLIGKHCELESAAECHFMDGDNTQDLFFRYYHPFADGKIALELYGTGIEFFQTSPEIRDERVSRDYDGKGHATGDFYFATYIQLLRNSKWPDMLARLACKTASGRRLDAARYSDTPGYFLDLSFGKDVLLGNTNTLRWFGMLGFYCWQTNSDEVFQNDAFMYGGGACLTSGKNSFSSELAGYSGYKDERDRPLVWRVDFKRDWGKKQLGIRYQKGLRHIVYHTIKVSLTVRLNN